MAGWGLLATGAASGITLGYRFVIETVRARSPRCINRTLLMQLEIWRGSECSQKTNEEGTVLSDWKQMVREPFENIQRGT
jgi:hypothetical protein